MESEEYILMRICLQDAIILVNRCSICGRASEIVATITKELFQYRTIELSRSQERGE